MTDNNKLASMVDYILGHPASTDYEWQLKNHYDYANFLRQPLALGMFIPFTPEGEVMEEPIADTYSVEDIDAGIFSSDHDKYIQAKERVLFEGWHVIGYEKDEDGVFVQIELNDEDLWLDFLTTGEVEIQNSHLGLYISTIEDLVPYNLTLTENAMELWNT